MNLKRDFQKMAGFTLVEMLVVLSIVGLMTGSATVAFTRFREARLVDNDAKAAYDFIRAAETKVQAGEKPTGCNGTLQRYKVALANATTLNYEGVCSSGSSVALSLKVGSNLTLKNYDGTAVISEISFYPIEGGATPSSVEVKKGTTIKTIQITSSGGIGFPVVGRVLPTITQSGSAGTCQESCLGQGSTNGTCRRNASSCTTSGEEYNSAGDSLCSGINNTCCCKPAVPTPTPTPGAAITSCSTFCNAAGFGAGQCMPTKNSKGQNIRANQICKLSGSSQGTTTGSRATSADKYCSGTTPACCCF